MGIKYGTALLFDDIVLRYGENLEKTITPFYYLLYTAMVSAFFIFLGASLRLALNSYQQELLRKTLESEKMSAELSFLKSQISPHFLFNSLNNIYSLTYHKSDKAPEAILKLADIMRYMIQENPDKLVSLNDEITYLKNYIALQQLRFKDPLALELEINADDLNYRIMPLLLISFLENAFKHGIVTDQEHPMYILIEALNSRLHFKISNLKSLVNKDEGKGIGLENLQRRLALGYPNKHTFNIQNGEKFYTSEFFVYL